MGRICSTHGGDENRIPSLVLSFMTVERDHILEVKNKNYKHLKCS